MQHHIAIIGGTTYDHIVYLPELPQPIPQTIHQAPFCEGVGSTGSGKALALTKLGIANTLYSVAGDDEYGKRIKKYLAEQEVDTLFDIDPSGTERHINIMDAHGGRISIFVTQSSELINHSAAAIEQLLQQSSVVVLNIIAYCRHLVPLIKKFNKPVWTDLHDYDGKNKYHDDFIDAAQYIHFSSDNLPDYQPLMQQLVDRGKELVICTHGKKGATLLTKTGEWLQQPALENTPVVDSNGAGDSFFAGFLYAYLHHYPLQRCLQYGAVCGAYAVNSPGLVFEKLSPLLVEQAIQTMQLH
jgi:sugar/nucleoside kinase (ribokinase family)